MTNFRVKDPKRNFLVASEVLKIVPPEDYPTRLDHIGNLFLIDQNKDGRFSVEELENFAMFYGQEAKSLKRYEYQF